MKTRMHIQSLLVYSIVICFLSINSTLSQKLEVQGELKVTHMNENQRGEKLVIRNTDGTLGSRNVETLPQSSLPIDSTRNTASDFELQKLLCDCPNPSTLLMKKLFESVYSPEDLILAGLQAEDVIDAARSGILIDPRDKEAYKTIEVGGMVWMAENLNVGTLIAAGTSQTDNSVIEKYCYDDITSNCDVYGGLYQWDEMMQYETFESVKGICPDSWHIPSDDEWKALEIHLGMTQSEADYALYRGTNQGSQIAGNEGLWTNGVLAENGVFGSSGFEALPGGYNNLFSFGSISVESYFWSSTQSSSLAMYRSLGHNFIQIYRDVNIKSPGFSVRCVKD